MTEETQQLKALKRLITEVESGKIVLDTVSFYPDWTQDDECVGFSVHLSCYYTTKKQPTDKQKQI